MDDPIADEIIKRSVDTMLECIGPDLWEESLLRPMDFGHSFLGPLETDERFKLRHGEAVAIDCVMNSMIANVQGHLSDADAQRVLDVYAAIGLPCSIEGITAETYKRAAREITVHRDGILRAPYRAASASASTRTSCPTRTSTRPSPSSRRSSTSTRRRSGTWAGPSRRKA